MITVLLLHLDGSVFKQFKNIQECSNFLGSPQVSTRCINKDCIIKRNYRLVTKDFYTDNYDIVSSWSPKTKGETTKLLNEQKSILLRNKKIVVHIDYKGIATEYKNYCTLARVMGLSKERVRQILQYGCKKHNIQFKYPELRGIVAKNLVV